MSWPSHEDIKLVLPDGARLVFSPRTVSLRVLDEHDELIITLGPRHVVKDTRRWLWEFADCLYHKGDIVVPAVLDTPSYDRLVRLPWGGALAYLHSRMGQTDALRVLDEHGAELRCFDAGDFMVNPCETLEHLFLACQSRPAATTPTV